VRDIGVGVMGLHIGVIHQWVKCDFYIIRDNSEVNDGCGELEIFEVDDIIGTWIVLWIK